MDTYSKTTLVSDDSDDSDSSKVHPSCTNNLEECAFYASKGMCFSKPLFMMNQCPLACLSCEVLDQFESVVGKRHPLSSPTFVTSSVAADMDMDSNNDGSDGDSASENDSDSDNTNKIHTISSFFENLKNKGFASSNEEENDNTIKVWVVTQPTKEEDPTGVRVGRGGGKGKKQSSRDNDNDDGKEEAIQNDHDEDDNDPYIIQIDDFLTADECDSLMDLANDEGMVDSRVNVFDHFDGTHKFQLPLRNSQSIECVDAPATESATETATETETAIDTDTSPKCSTATSSIIQKLGELMDISPRNFEPAQVVHYPPGGYYTLHNDYIPNDEWKPAGPRVLSMYITLNEAENGGSIGFPKLDWLIVKPKRGSVLLWFNVADTTDEQQQKKQKQTKHDDRLLHDGRLMNEVLPIEKGDLYMMQTHVHLYDYVNAQNI